MEKDDPIPTLIEELARHKGRDVFIGSRSSFFFIGPAEEAMDSLPLLSAMLKHIASPRSRLVLNPSDGVRLGRRRVKAVCENEVGSGTVILVEGSEFGDYWTRNEYLAGKKRLLSYLKPV